MLIPACFNPKPCLHKVSIILIYHCSILTTIFRNMLPDLYKLRHFCQLRSSIHMAVRFKYKYMYLHFNRLSGTVLSLQRISWNHHNILKRIGTVPHPIFSLSNFSLSQKIVVIRYDDCLKQGKKYILNSIVYLVLFSTLLSYAVDDIFFPCFKCWKVAVLSSYLLLFLFENGFFFFKYSSELHF